MIKKRSREKPNRLPPERNMPVSRLNFTAYGFERPGA